MRKRSVQKPRSPLLRTVKYVLLTITATCFFSLSLIYFIRHRKSSSSASRSLFAAYLASPPPSPVLAKSRRIFAAYRRNDDEALAKLINSIDPAINPEEYHKVLYDHSLVTKPHLAHLAISSARISVLKILLESNLIDVNDLFLIHHTIKNLKKQDYKQQQQEDILELLFEHKADLNLADSKGFPPVAVAILYANLPALSFLTRHQAKLNVAFARSPSLLHYAVTRPAPSHEIIEHLLINNANVFHYGPDGRTPFHLTLTTRPYNPALIEVFLSHHAPHIDKDEYLKRLLNYPTSPKQVAKPTANTRYAYTPLHIAVAAYNTKLVQLLREKGADTHRIDTSGLTPIELAKQLKQHKMIKIFQNE